MEPHLLRIRQILGEGLIPALAVLAIIFLCSPYSRGQGLSFAGHNPAVTLLTPGQAYELLSSRARDLVILDIRTPGEFATGHIKGAINMDYRSGAFAREIGRLDRSRTYLVYCRTGRRTAGAIDIMTALGFRRIIQVAGDIEGWKAAGLPLVTPPRRE
jgi:rhodanese-related sulfurtransferase